MFRNIFTIFFVLASLATTYAQGSLLNAKKVDQTGKKSTQQTAEDKAGPLPYKYVADRDILWSTIVWENIDFNQKFNFPYHFPIDSVNALVSADRRSLYDNLMKGITKDEIINYYDDSELKSLLTKEEVIAKTVKKIVPVYGDDYDEEEEGPKKSEAYEYIYNSEVTGLRVKGIWFFDKLQGELRYRLLALAPLGPDIGLKGEDSDAIAEAGINVQKIIPLFWLYYPEVRDLLHRAKVFNPDNALHSISFDHMLNSRRFHSVIIRQENMYGNRSIKDYIPKNSLFQLLEADKIKEGIRNKEMDMWNY
jgi:gliding motility associated protien GldN